MYKKLIGVAIVSTTLAAPAVFADSANVNIGGRIIVGVDTFKFAQGNGATVAGRTYNNELRVDDGGSAFNFSGSEDLGGGLKGSFLITMPFQPDGGGITATGNTWVGLGGDFGTIKVGRDSIHYIELVPIELMRAGDLQSFMSMGIGLQVNGTSAYLIIPTRTSNLIEWQSPNWGGITATLAYSTAPTTNEGQGTSTGTISGSKGNGEHVAVRYVTANPLMGGLSYWKATIEQNVSGLGAVPNTAVAVPNNNEKSQTAWVGYRFPFGLKAGLAYNQGQVTTATTPTFVTPNGPTVKRNAYIVPLTYTAGVHNFYLEYAKAGKTSGAAVNDDTGATQWLLGWDMALSKRTFVGAYYTKLDNEKNAAYSLFSSGAIAAGANVSTTTALPSPGESTTHIWVGIAHSF